MACTHRSLQIWDIRCTTDCMQTQGRGTGQGTVFAAVHCVCSILFSCLLSLNAMLHPACDNAGAAKCAELLWSAP